MKCLTLLPPSCRCRLKNLETTLSRSTYRNISNYFFERQNFHTKKHYLLVTRSPIALVPFKAYKGDIPFSYSCGSLVHLLEKLFTDPSLANMVIFCANVFFGLSGITILLIMDIISESEVRIKYEYNFGADRVNNAFDAFILNFHSPTLPS